MRFPKSGDATWPTASTPGPPCTAKCRCCPILVLIRGGAAFDPATRPGLAAITGDLLDEGCGDLDALALHDALGRLGAQLDTEVGSDATIVGITTLERSSAPLAGAPRRDDCQARACTRTTSIASATFGSTGCCRCARCRRRSPSASLRECLYGAHPYGHLPIGDQDSLRAMSVGETQAFHRRDLPAVADDGHRRRQRIARLAGRGDRRGVRRLAG